MIDKLDDLDKKILQELSIDARQTYRQIAKKINSKKDSVAYHIANLENKKILQKYVPVISLAKLGIHAGKIYFRLQGMNTEDEKNIYNKLINNKKVIWVAKTTGAWDLMLGFFFKTLDEFIEMKNNTIQTLYPFIEEYQITFIEKAFVFDRAYLYKNALARQSLEYRGNSEKVVVDKIDLQLLSAIKNDGRYEYKTVSKLINKDTKTINSRINNLKKIGVIQGTTVFINVQNIGFQLYKLSIYLKEQSEKSLKKLSEYLKEDPNTIHLIKVMGPWELEVEIEHNSIEEIYDYITLIKNKFYLQIKKIDLTIIKEELKLEFFPEIN